MRCTVAAREGAFPWGRSFSATAFGHVGTLSMNGAQIVYLITALLSAVTMPLSLAAPSLSSERFVGFISSVLTLGVSLYGIARN
jgi:hypothetical protein